MQVGPGRQGDRGVDPIHPEKQNKNRHEIQKTGEMMQIFINVATAGLVNQLFYQPGLKVKQKESSYPHNVMSL